MPYMCLIFIKIIITYLIAKQLNQIFPDKIINEFSINKKND